MRRGEGRKKGKTADRRNKETKSWVTGSRKRKANGMAGLIGYSKIIFINTSCNIQLSALKYISTSTKTSIVKWQIICNSFN